MSELPDLVLDELLSKLQRAIKYGASEKVCHRHWSRFIRARDRYQCVICGSGDSLQAHHVCRRSFLWEARFLTGNGATLCKVCHAEAHAGFNGAPDLGQPMNAQGGEKIEGIAELFRTLAYTAAEREPQRDEYYHLSESVLMKFALFQGFDPERPLYGSPIQRAWRIWDCSGLHMITAVLRANLLGQ